MVKMNLYNRVEAVRNVAYGCWVRGVMESTWETECVSAKSLEKDSNGFYIHSYHLTVTKEDGLWIAYAEDHEWGELKEQLGIPSEFQGWKTLKDAKLGVQPFIDHFDSCYEENYPELY